MGRFNLFHQFLIRPLQVPAKWVETQAPASLGIPTKNRTCKINPFKRKTIFQTSILGFQPLVLNRPMSLFHPPMKAMMHWDPNRRGSAAKILHHPYFEAQAQAPFFLKIIRAFFRRRFLFLFFLVVEQKMARDEKKSGQTKMEGGE